MDEKKSARKRMSLEDREKVKTLLLEGGISKRQIARIMDVSFSVIWRFEKRLRETGSIVDRPQSGRPRMYHSPSEDWIEIEGEHKFQCTHCLKTFIHHAQLREHVRTHTGEKPYKCDKCFRAFRASSSLKRHMVSHSDERPFMCDFCAKTFSNLPSLQLHIRIHTGEKPYECKYCERRCTTAGNLNAHMRVHKDLVNKTNMGTSQTKLNQVMKNITEDEIKKESDVQEEDVRSDQLRSYKNERKQETFVRDQEVSTYVAVDNWKDGKFDQCEMDIKVEPHEEKDLQ